MRLLDEAGVDFTYLGTKELCCGTPMLVAGKWDLFVEVMKTNIASVKAAGADTVITSCPACDMMWRHVYPQWAEKLGIDFDITAKHYSEVREREDRGRRVQLPRAARKAPRSRRSPGTTPATSAASAASTSRRAS